MGRIERWRLSGTTWWREPGPGPRCEDGCITHFSASRAPFNNRITMRHRTTFSANRHYSPLVLSHKA